jgi:nucleoside-diphosphate-sugar epimerase
VRVLVTGATGFLGRHVVDAARRRGLDVVAAVRPTSASRHALPPGVRTAVMDLRAPAPAAALDGVDAVIQAAARKAGGFDEQWASTVVGTENLLGAMASAGVHRLVHVSSFSVYDYDRLRVDDLLDESAPLAAVESDRDDYAVTKLWQERLVRGFARDHAGEVTVVRPGAVWGPGDVVGPTVTLDIGPRSLVVAPDATLPLTYVESCADAVVAAAERRSAIGATVNVVDDDLPSRRRFLHEVGAAGLWDRPTTALPWWAAIGVASAAQRTNRACFDGRARLPGILVPSRVRARFLPLRFTNDRARAVLGWSPAFDLDAALARVLSPIALAGRSEAA